MNINLNVYRPSSLLISINWAVLPPSETTDTVNAFQLCFACGSGLQLARNAGEFVALWLCSKGVNWEEQGRYSRLTEYGNNNNYKANQQEAYS